MIVDQLLPLAATGLPILAIIFVLGLTLHKGYINIRSRYNARVNCWFCSVDTSVPYAARNSWTCPHCEQYNGFTKDGDYNRDITSQRDCSQVSQKSSSQGSSSICANSYYADVLGSNPTAAMMANNGLCDQCNEAQRLKVEKLSQFEPKNEASFDRELKVFRECLEQQFRLCSSCERHVNKVLHEKKKMVLGSKFLNFIIKGAALLKQPYINRLATAQRQRKLQRLRHVMTILTVINILCLLCRLPLATSEQFTKVLGQSLGSALFYVYSHGLTLLRVLGSAVVGTLAEQRDLTAKLILYLSTFGKLLLYSVGLSHQQAQQATFASCFMGIYPFVMLALSFLHKINDGLKFTRFTVILLLWSAHAKGISLLAPHIDGITFILLGSVITLGLLVTNRSNLLRQADAVQDESAGESFHRLCADECISDEETLSMLSQQLSDCSNLSLRTPTTACPSPAPTISQRTARTHHHQVAASSMLSLDSLHLSNQQQAWRSNYGGGVAATGSTVVSAAPPPPLHAQHPAMVFQQQKQQQQQHHQQQQQQHQQMMMRQWNRAGGAPHNNSLANGQRDFARSTQSLLMPSRLPGGGARSSGLGGDVSAWLAANQSMNQDLRTASLLSHPRLYPGYEEKQTTQLPQQLSRTSSQSSGFESHPRPESFPGPAAAGFPCSVVPPPALSPAAASDYHFARSTQQAMQPGDLLRKWIDDGARAPHHIH